MKTAKKEPSSPLAAPRRGRPRAFDADAALERAMHIFWKHGYEGASLPALTRAMGINRPSLYAAFGNKESLFRKALDRYVESAGQVVRDALALPTARQVADHLLRSTIQRSAASKARGCLLVQGALACGADSDCVRQELARRRAQVEAALRDRFLRARAEGDLPRRSDPAALAKYIATFHNGLAVQLSAGASPASLLASVDIALRAFAE